MVTDAEPADAREVVARGRRPRDAHAHPRRPRRVRSVEERRRRGDGDHHADLLGLPGDRGDARRHAAPRWPTPDTARSRCARCSRRPWSTDWISEAGRRKLAEAGVAPPGPGRRRRATGPVPLTLGAAVRVGPVPALRRAGDRGALPLRPHGLHGAAPLPGCRRAVRAHEGDLMAGARDRRGRAAHHGLPPAARRRRRAALRRRRRRDLRRARRAARRPTPSGPAST